MNINCRSAPQVQHQAFLQTVRLDCRLGWGCSHLGSTLCWCSENVLSDSQPLPHQMFSQQSNWLRYSPFLCFQGSVDCDDHLVLDYFRKTLMKTFQLFIRCVANTTKEQTQPRAKRLLPFSGHLLLAVNAEHSGNLRQELQWRHKRVSLHLHTRIITEESGQGQLLYDVL